MQEMPAQRSHGLIDSEDTALMLPDDGRFREVWHNVVVCRYPASSYHGRVGGKLAHLFGRHALAGDLGEVPISDTGYRLRSHPLTILAPDVSFIGKERLGSADPRGYHNGAPDHAGEILSPNQSLTELLAKGETYRSAGCQLVWIIDPAERTAWELRPSEPARRLEEHHTLVGDPVLSGFRCELHVLFP